MTSGIELSRQYRWEVQVEISSGPRPQWTTANLGVGGLTEAEARGHLANYRDGGWTARLVRITEIREEV